MLSLYGVSLVHCSVSIKTKGNLHSNFNVYLRIPLHNRLLLDHENNSNSEAEGLKENVSVVLNLVHVVLTRLNSQLYTVKAS